MSPIKTFHRKREALIFRIIERLKQVSFPGFERVPIYEVGVFFLKGILKGSVNTRASAISFSFFLSVFPSIIFLFNLIPYVPISNFQEELLLLLESIMPENAFLATQEILTDIITKQRSSLLSVGFLAALYFSTNGISALISAFNASIHTKETRPWVSRRIISLVLVLILSLLLTTAIVLITFSQLGLNFLMEKEIIKDEFYYYLLLIGKWLIILALLFFAISFLYYLGPNEKLRWKFFSAGSTFATLFTILISKGFSIYVNNFGQYNTLYGSIGTLIVVLLWMNFNALVLLIGFELNVSIKNAHIVNIQDAFEALEDDLKSDTPILEDMPDNTTQTNSA